MNQELENTETKKETKSAIWDLAVRSGPTIREGWEAFWYIMPDCRTTMQIQAFTKAFTDGSPEKKENHAVETVLNAVGVEYDPIIFNVEGAGQINVRKEDMERAQAAVGIAVALLDLKAVEPDEILQFLKVVKKLQPKAVEAEQSTEGIAP